MKRLRSCIWQLLLFVLAAAAAIAGGMAVFSEGRAQRAELFFSMLRHTKGRFAGQPFTLLSWERTIIRDVYGTVNERGTRQYKYAYVEIPKKNGKSELAAGASLFHLFADGEKNGEVYGCAADRSQASIVFDVAVDMVDQVPALKKRTKLHLSHKRMTDKVSGTYYQVLSAEAYTKHGLNLSACVFDELHAQPSRGLWDVMTFGAGDARLQPLWWVITTAGDDPDRVSIGWEQHEYALKLLAGEAKDPTWYPVIYSYQGDDIYNEEHWAQANPSLGSTITVESLREAAARAKTKPAEERLFRWLRLNQWTTSKLTTWLPLDLFDSTVGTWTRADLLGKQCYLGMDLSSTNDLTAVCALFPPQAGWKDWRCFWECWIPEASLAERVRQDRVPYDQWAAAGWMHVTPGEVVDYTDVERVILEMQKFYQVIEVPSDRAFAAMLLQRLEQAGLTCVDVPQNFKTMTGPINLAEVLFRVAGGKVAPQRAPSEEEKVEEEQPAGVDETERMKAELAKALGGDSLKLMYAGITHEASPVARWAFGNASLAMNGNGEKKLVKEHLGKSVVRTKRIDPMVALVNAMARAQFWKNQDLNADILSGDWGM